MAPKKIEIEKGGYKMVQTPNRDVYVYKDGRTVMHIMQGRRRLTKYTFDWYLDLLKFVETTLKKDKEEMNE